MVTYPDKLFHLQLLDAAKEYGDEIALTDAHTEEDLTYSRLREDSYRFASALKLLGALKGDIVCVLLENCLQYATVFLGSALLGCPVSGINPASTACELERYLKLTRSKYLIVSADSYQTARTCAWQCELIVVDRQYGQTGSDFCSLLKKYEADYLMEPDEELALNDTLLTPFSSGTSGPPKCVQLTHRNFNAATSILRKAVFDELTGDKRRPTLGLLPFYHGSGFWALCYCLLVGHRTIVIGRFHPAIMLDFIEKYKIDTLNLVPSIINHLCREDMQISRWDLSSVKTVLCGSAPLGKELCKRFLKKFPHVVNLVQGYGMTELVVLSHITPLNTPITNERYLGSCGKLLPGFQAKLLEEGTGSEERGPWKRGELLLRSDTIMKGYLHDEESTKHAIDRNGWLHTGDIVYFDSDGFYYVVDRLKDLIKVNGMQVSPAELEDILKCHPNIADAGVIGISDEQRGQVPKAFVVLVNKYSRDSKPERIVQYVQERVAPHKYLRGGVQIVDSLPKTASGKIIRRELVNTTHR